MEMLCVNVQTKSISCQNEHGYHQESVPTDVDAAVGHAAPARSLRQRARVVRAEDESYYSEWSVSAHGRDVGNIDGITSGWMQTFQPPNVLVWRACMSD